MRFPLRPNLLFPALTLALLVACASEPPTSEPADDAARDVGFKDADADVGGDVPARVDADPLEDTHSPRDVTDDGSSPDASPDDVRQDVSQPTDVLPDDAEDVPSHEDVREDPSEDVAEDPAAPDTTPDTTPDPDRIGVEAWQAGVLSGVPARTTLRALPGGGEGGPVLVSNNPEIFTGDGLLYGNARPSPTRGGRGYRLSGDFGVYLHHLNRASGPLYVSLVVTNPNDAPVTVQARGSGYTQTETGGLGLGTSPDYRVSREWLLDEPATVVGPSAIQPFRPLLIWQKRVNSGAEVDGRFGLHSDLPVYVYVVATSSSDLNEAVQDALIDAPGDYRVSGNPPPPFGREAGVYAHDTWRAAFTIEVPEGPAHVAFMVNTATGGGLPQIQAFPALDHYDQSAAEAVGMYGNVYDLDVTLAHPGGGGPRQVRVTFSSLATGNASRWWDGVGLVDGREIVVRHVPGSETTVLGELTLQPGATRSIHFSAMVPGLAAIPQALAVEVLP